MTAVLKFEAIHEPRELLNLKIISLIRVIIAVISSGGTHFPKANQSF